MLSDAGIAVVECSLGEAGPMAHKAAQNGHAFTRIVVDSEDDLDSAAAALDALVDAAAHSKQDPLDVRGLVLVNMNSRDTLPAFQEVGFESYLVRPVRPKTVFEQLLAERRDTGSSIRDTSSNNNSTPTRAQRSGLRFLLVEDNDINALLVDHQLKKLGHHVERAVDGTEAVAAIENVISEDLPPFDVILMDVLLPEMDGLEATRRIKRLVNGSLPQERHPPVIALTANAFEEDKQRCLDAGMDDYLAKPFDQDMLISVLARCGVY